MTDKTQINDTETEVVEAEVVETKNSSLASKDIQPTKTQVIADTFVRSLRAETDAYVQMFGSLCNVFEQYGIQTEATKRFEVECKKQIELLGIQLKAWDKSYEVIYAYLDLAKTMLVPCLHDPKVIQYPEVYNAVLKTILGTQNLHLEQIKKLPSLSNQNSNSNLAKTNNQ